MSSTAFDPARIAADFESQEPSSSEISAMAQVIDLHEALTATGYGAKEQRELGEVSDMLLRRASGSALQDAVNAIHALQQQIEALDIPSLSKPKGFFHSLFAPEKRQLAALRRNYTDISCLVDRLANQLDMARLALQKEIGLLDTLYASNQACYQAMNLKILAGEQALDMQKASAANTPDSESFADLFSARLNQLRQSKAICLQQALQIRLTQHNQQQVANKLKQTAELALPLWKNQLALALNIHKQQEIFTSYREAARRSFQALRDGSGDAAEKSQAALREIARFRETDLQLKQLMNETLQDIQEAKSMDA